MNVDNIYAKIVEHSYTSARPHKTVMGFVFVHDQHSTLMGGVTLWWNKPYLSNKQDIAEFDIIDWMHDHDLYVKTLITLQPLQDGEPNGLAMVFKPMDGPAVIPQIVMDYIDGMMISGSTDAGSQDREDQVSDADPTVD